MLEGGRLCAIPCARGSVLLGMAEEGSLVCRVQGVGGSGMVWGGAAHLTCCLSQQQGL